MSGPSACRRLKSLQQQMSHCMALFEVSPDMMMISQPRSSSALASQAASGIVCLHASHASLIIIHHKPCDAKAILSGTHQRLLCCGCYMDTMWPLRQAA